jgi:uncharacterized membrane protein YfcA
VLNVQTIGFSLALVPLSVLAMYVGGKIHDRINQVVFRRATLLVLLMAGLNLLRRGFFS